MGKSKKKKIHVGDKLRICHCFFEDSTAHPTEVDAALMCSYCGYFAIEEKVDKKFLARYIKRKSLYDEAKHKVFQKRMLQLSQGKEFYDKNINDKEQG